MPENKNSFYTITVSNMLMLPKVVSSLMLEKENSLKALTAAVRTGTNLLIVTQKNAAVMAQNISVNNVYPMGVVCKIVDQDPIQDGHCKVLLEGLQKAEVKQIHLEDSSGALVAEVEVLQDYHLLSADPKAMILTKKIIEGVTKYLGYTKEVDRNGLELIERISSPEEICYLTAHVLKITVAEKHKILVENDVLKKLELVLTLLNRENSFMAEEKEINHKMEQKITEMQKKHFLNERIRIMQKELGDDDEDDLESLKTKIKKLKLSPEAREKCNSELKKLKKSQSVSAEAGVIRNYLDTILELPWGTKTDTQVDLQTAAKVLDDDHYGLEDVKERILEFIAVQKRTHKLHGSILCFVGSPGVGKTSLARSIARAVGRNYVKISLGGMKDEAEIRGHRKTYVGAMPGKIIQSLIKAKSCNPLILLDEIDKLGADFRGDPSSALLEVLDPEQNREFNDHYLEIDFDLSDVMFVTTANSLQEIPAPLRDRMEIISLSGYTEQEKLAIAKQHLLPKAREMNGLTEAELTIDDAALTALIRGYTFEAGVRGLEKEINKIARKIVRKLVENEEGAIAQSGDSSKKNSRQASSSAKCKHSKLQMTKLNITVTDLKEYLGVEKFSYQRSGVEDAVGVSTGMAYTDFGGDLLSIEVVRYMGKGNLKLTGKLGEVMKESAETAFSQVKCLATQLHLSIDNFNKYDYHLHVPEGATPKDGPSAGTAIATALMSCVTGLPVDKNIAMTGEITLTGKVLPIGGLKEKLLAAVRGGIKTVLIPEKNLKDLEKLPEIIKQTLTIKPVKAIEEVLPLTILGYQNLAKKRRSGKAIKQVTTRKSAAKQ